MILFAADKWAHMLTLLGVGHAAVKTWAPIFAAGITDRSFSAGWQRELPDFIAQLLHESAMLTRLEEGLSYSTPERLMAVWPKRFPTVASAQPFVRNPRLLANKVYGDRMGNRPGTDDGWDYRGSGLIQVTGRDNFAQIERSTGLPVLASPELLRKPDHALRVALDWWERNVPDAVMGDRTRVRRAVNGGTHGLTETTRLAERAQALMVA